MIVWKIVGAVVTLPLLFFVPGCVVFRSRLFRSWSLSWPGRMLVVVAISVSVASLVALFLAEAGHLSIWLLDLILAGIALLARLVLGSTGRSLRMPGPASWELVAVLFLVVLSVLLFFKPGEYVVGDGDPGYYFNNGYHIADTGSVAIYEDSVPSMSDYELNAFYARGVVQFTPFHLRSRPLGKVMPLLYHLMPVWIGIFIMLFGRMGGLYLLPLFGMLGVLSVFALGRRYSGVGGATLGAVFLGLFFPQVWFSRYPASEVFAQFFIVSALLFFLQMRDDDDPVLGVASALALTAAACARPEVLLVLVPLLAVVVFDMLADRYKWGDLAFVNAVLIGLVYIWLYIKYAVLEYFFIHTLPLLRLARSRSNMNAMMFLALGAIVLGFVLFNHKALIRTLGRWGTRLRQAVGERATTLETAFKASLAVLLLLAFAYYYFIAPRGVTSSNAQHRFFYNLALFFGGIGLFAFAMGFCYMLYKTDAATSFVLGSLVLIFTVAFTQSRLTAPHLPWLTRRYMTVVVPLLFLGAGYAFARLWRKNVGFKVVIAGLTVGFVALFCFFLAPVATKVEYQGIDNQLEAFAEQADGDLVIFTDPFLGDVLGIPLRYQYGVDARVTTGLGSAAELQGLVEKYAAEGRKVMMEGSGTGAPTFDPDVLNVLSLRRAITTKISFPRLRITYGARPRSFGTQEFDLEFYYLEPGGTGAGP